MNSFETPSLLDFQKTSAFYGYKVFLVLLAPGESLKTKVGELLIQGIEVVPISKIKLWMEENYHLIDTRNIVIADPTVEPVTYHNSLIVHVPCHVFYKTKFFLNGLIDFDTPLSIESGGQLAILGTLPL